MTFNRLLNLHIFWGEDYNGNLKLFLLLYIFWFFCGVGVRVNHLISLKFSPAPPPYLEMRKLLFSLLQNWLMSFYRDLSFLWFLLPSPPGKNALLKSQCLQDIRCFDTLLSTALLSPNPFCKRLCWWSMGQRGITRATNKTRRGQGTWVLLEWGEWRWINPRWAEGKGMSVIMNVTGGERETVAKASLLGRIRSRRREMGAVFNVSVSRN